MAREFDELNASEKNNRSIPFDIYFGEMELMEEQKERRIAVAEELDELMLFLLALIATMVENDSLDKDYILTQINQRYLHIVGKYVDVDEYTENHIRQFSSTFLKTTIDNITDSTYLSSNKSVLISEREKCIENTKEIIKDTTNKKSWYLSSDRATFIAENESNNVVSHDEYVKAIKSGRTQKQWITMRDKRVRHTHMVLDSKTIGIGETFKVGNSFMNFPRDEEFFPDPQEVISCRCSIKYF